MYVIKRGQSAWLCGDKAKNAYEVDAVQLRLRGEFKNVDVFEERLDNWETIEAGVISVYKCSNSSKCEDCEKFTRCEILNAVQETTQAHAEFSKWVKANGGYLL